MYSIVAIIVGVAVMILTAVVIFGGVKKISNVCSKLVPLMAAFYVLGCIKSYAVAIMIESI